MSVSETSHSSDSSHHVEHDAYGDKLIWLPALGVAFAGAGMLHLLDQNFLWGLIGAGGFFVLLMVYFFYRATRAPHPDFVPERNLQMWGFLASEVVFFTAIIGVSLVVRMLQTVQGNTWGNPAEQLDIPLTALNTFILICSSLTMVLAQDAVKRNDLRKVKFFLIATFLIGAAFLSIQVYEYNNLMTQHNFTPEHSLFAATFYLQTGFHGFHVTIGLVALIGVILASLRGKFTKDNHNGLELMGLYWHFVDLVWIVLFALVYLI
ncbi:MAG: cytochrome c oxidase subunit 3 [Candidatus Hodarchaeales archaeon]|jgi:heme/copper-type cytochrome/quinol oxidase subunit 3